jgi:hypothetical protein
MQRPPLSPTARPRMQCARRFRAGPAARLDLSAQFLRRSWGRHRGGRSRGSRPPQRDHNRANGGETTLHERRRRLRRCSARVRRYRASVLVQDGAHQHLSPYPTIVSRKRRSRSIRQSPCSVPRRPEEWTTLFESLCFYSSLLLNALDQPSSPLIPENGNARSRFLFRIAWAKRCSNPVATTSCAWVTPQARGRRGNARSRVALERERRSVTSGSPRVLRRRERRSEAASRA